jgi:general secretion pathway protein I
MSGPRGEHGFTLMETLVAFVILSLAMVALFRAVSDTAAGFGKIERHAAALEIAQSLLEAAGADQALAARNEAGTAVAFRWQRHIRPYRPPDGRSTSPAAFWVTVEVAWPERGGAIEVVQLTTLKLEEVRR